MPPRPPRILHVLDSTTPPDAIETLAQLLPLCDRRLVALGHHSTQQLATAAGITEPITFLHSMGWADPTGWRALRGIIGEVQPTHVHAWGIPAAIATAMARFKGPRLVTLVDMPNPRYLQLLQFIHKGGLWVSVSPCHWTVSATWLKRELHSHSIAADAVTLIRAGVTPARHCANDTREELGILPGDGPILLLGGDGGTGTMLAQPGIDPKPHGGTGGPRHDLGLWAAAVLQTIFPRIRAVVREDPRGRPDPGLERLMNDLPDDDVVVIAPANWSWPKLLSIADAFVVTPDGPFAAGSLLQAFGAQVPVIGTPVDSIREHITDQHNGLLAASTRPRTIAAAVEHFFANPALREKLTQQALADAAARHDPAAQLRSFTALYN